MIGRQAGYTKEAQIGEKFKNLTEEMGQAIQMIHSLKKKSPGRVKDFKKTNTVGEDADPLSDRKFSYKTRQRSRTFGEAQKMTKSLGPVENTPENEEDHQQEHELPFFKDSQLQTQHLIPTPKNGKPEIRIAEVSQEQIDDPAETTGHGFQSVLLPRPEKGDSSARAGLLEVPAKPDPKQLTTSINSEVLWEPNLEATRHHPLYALALEKSNDQDRDFEGEEFQDELERKFSIMQDILGKLQEEELASSKHPEAREMHETALMGTAKRLHQKHKQTSKNLGLFFGHENWSLMMNLMIGFRQGLKM